MARKRAARRMIALMGKRHAARLLAIVEEWDDGAKWLFFRDVSAGWKDKMLLFFRNDFEAREAAEAAALSAAIED